MAFMSGLMTVFFIIGIVVFLVVLTVVLLSRFRIIKLTPVGFFHVEAMFYFSIILIYTYAWFLIIFSVIDKTLPTAVLLFVCMIAPLIALSKWKHRLYYRTLSILRGRAELLPIFKELQAFIQSKYDAVAYNFLFRQDKSFMEVLLDADDAGKERCLLEVQLATAKDYGKMGKNNFIATLSSKEAIAEKFFELANKYNYAKLESGKDIRVCYYDFSDKMKTEINRKVVKKAGRFIKKKYFSYNVWLVRGIFDSSVVFFRSNEDLKNSSNIRMEIEDDYFSLLKQRDKFDVFDRSRFHLEFDSKQNFDENYGGSWFRYLC